MLKLLCCLFFLLGFAASPLGAKEAGRAKVAAAPFPQQGSDLKPDPAAKFGILANGFRYVVMPNHEPKGRVSLRLLVLAGSLDEADDQRGLAHFVEHMAFNGSEHYPPGTLVEFFQRMGMSFGGDTNANTSFDRTLYQLELPHADDATIAEGLRVFRDYASGLLFPEPEVEKQRGVVLAEKRAVDSVGFRTFVSTFEATLGSTRLPHRIPIGDPEVISHAPRARMLDYWKAWYQPDRMVAIVVGDFADPVKVEKQVRRAFENARPLAPPQAEPSLGEVPKLEGVRSIFHAEPEAAATTVEITSIAPYGREKDSAARRIRRLPRWLVLQMLNRRLSILAKKDDAPFSSASASVSERFNFIRESSIEVICKPEQWSDALGVAEQELRRALEHGFTASELHDAVANSINALEQVVKTSGTRRSNTLAEQIASSLVAGDVFTTPEVNLALGRPALEKITTDDCLAAMQEDFGAEGRYVVVTGNVAIPGDALAAITAAYEQARTVPVAAVEGDAIRTWGYTDFGPAGEIVKREHVADLDLDLVTFKNGVRLNLKKTDFEAGRITMTARLGNGAITEPPEQRGIGALAARTFLAGGLGKHSADDIRDLFAGKNVSWQFAPEPDAFRFAGGTTPADLDLQLQFLAAAITDPGYRPEALRLARKNFEQMYLAFQHTTAGPLATDIANLLASGDPRFGMPPLETMLTRTLEEVQAWLAPQLAHGALEIGIAGDLDLDATIAAAARTVGALPPRDERPPLDALKMVKFPAQPFAKDYTIESEIPKGALLLYWPTDDGLEIHRSRRLFLLAAILNDRLRVKVREEIGGTYSPHAASQASEVFPGYGYMVATVDVEPGETSKIADLVVDLADDLARHGVSEDELNRARQPMLTALHDSERRNSYWVFSVLQRAQEKPEVLDWARSRLADLQGITAAELSELAQKFFGRARVSRATILPALATPNEK